MSAEVVVNASESAAGPITAGGGATWCEVGERLVQYGRRFWHAMRRCWWSSYWRLDVHGAEHVPQRGAVLLCANHASHLDAPAILAALPRHVALHTSTAPPRTSLPTTGGARS
jgi:hypothetical protein